MADHGEFLLAGMTAGLLYQSLRANESGIAIYSVEPLMDINGLARPVIKVEMASGTYYMTITETDAHLDDSHLIKEDP